MSLSTVLPDLLYLGNIGNSEDIDLLSRLGIKHILSVTPKKKDERQRLYERLGIVCKFIEVEDFSDTDLLSVFQEAHAFIDNSLDNSIPCLVHCNEGVSRSPTIVLSFLMKKENKSLFEAFVGLSAQRSVICPNIGFVKQLQEYEKTLNSNPTQTQQFKLAYMKQLYKPQITAAPDDEILQVLISKDFHYPLAISELNFKYQWWSSEELERKYYWFTW